MAKSKEEIIYDIENNLVDPTTNKITGERVKSALTEMVDAMGQGGGGQMKYWKSANPAVSLKVLAAYMSLAKGVAYGEVVIAPGGLIADFAENVSAVAFDGNARMYAEGEFLILGEFLASMGFDESSLIQITEEEFYTI